MGLRDSGKKVELRKSGKGGGANSGWREGEKGAGGTGGRAHGGRGRGAVGVHTFGGPLEGVMSVVCWNDQLGSVYDGKRLSCGEQRSRLKSHVQYLTGSPRLAGGVKAGVCACVRGGWGLGAL